MNPKQQRFFDRCHELTEWLLAQPGKCFKAWPRETVFFYVAFHALCGTLFVIRKASTIKAVMIAEPRPLDRIEKPFCWQKPTSGNCALVWEMVGGRKFVAELWQKFNQQFPGAERFFAYRNKKLVEFPRTAVERLAYV